MTKSKSKTLKQIQYLDSSTRVVIELQPIDSRALQAIAAWLEVYNRDHGTWVRTSSR